MAKNDEQNIKQNTIAKRIIGLVIFINSLFLVAILSGLVFLYMENNREAKVESADFQTQAVVSSVSKMLGKAEEDINKLSTDSDIVAYLNYVKAGNDPIIINTSDPNYSIYSNYLLKTQAVMDYQTSDIYNLIFVASDTECSSGSDGCAISQDGELSNSDWKLTERPWYTSLGENDSVLSKPYQDSLTDNYTITYAKKVFDGQTLIGYIGLDIHMDSLAAFLDTLNQSVVQTHNDIAIFTDFDTSPKLIYITEDFAQDYFMKDASDYQSIDDSNGYNGTGMVQLIENYNPDQTVPENIFNKDFLISYTSIDKYNLEVVSLVDNTQILSIEMLFGIIGLAIVLLILIISLFLSRNIKYYLSPINTILSTIDEIKNGNYDVEINIEEANEIKQIGEAINIMSSEIKNQMQLVYDNYAYDILTGLKNRSASRQEIDQTIFQSNKRAAVCLIQVDNLKDINVTKGHVIGDNFIKAIAEELKKIIKNDTMIFSNSENEFIYIIENFSTLNSVEYELNKLLLHFKEPLIINNIKIVVKFNIGVSIYPTDGNTLDELTKKCDMAVYKITDKSIKPINFYNEKIARDLSYHVEVSEQLSQAIEKNELQLKFQPLIGRENDIYGFEALVRWTSPSLGDISPEIFIANAEESYLIIPIGTWILREACKAQVELFNRLGKKFMMSVNVSPIQLAQKDFVKVVKSIIRETGCDTSYLALEITEGIFIKSSVVLDDKIDELHELGIQVSLDDFGTGYASLTNLRQISFDNLKIDKSFVDGIFGNEKEHRIIGTLVSLVHNLGMKVIAEGIETKKQFEYLKQISTDVFQGYIFSKPIDFEDAVVFIEEYYKVPKSKRNDILTSKNE